MGIFALVKKDMIIQTRYKLLLLNFSITPFFIIAPFVFIAKILNNSLEEFVFISTMMWYWLNQYFFSLGGLLKEERAEGNFVSVFLSPISLIKHIFLKGIFVFLNCSYITIITMVFFKIFTSINKSTSIFMFFIYLMSGLYLFCFSIFFTSLTLIFRQLNSMNFAIQYGIGLLSGMSSNPEKFSKPLLIISNLIPLTYTIKIGRGILSGSKLEYLINYIFILSILSILFFFIGYAIIKYSERRIRKTGEFELW